jgi:hypothetical protein
MNCFSDKLPLCTSFTMADEMDIDPPAPAPANAMSALMAGAREKGKGKMFDGAGMSDVDQKALKEKEGLPWYVSLLPPFQMSLRRRTP